VSAQHTLEQVLERTAACLAAARGQATVEGSGEAEEEEEGEGTESEGMDDGEEDDDESDDAYYGEDIDVVAMDVGLLSQAQAR
jgi:hypothetical protein